MSSFKHYLEWQPIPRKNNKDIWNAATVKNCTFSTNYDIPICQPHRIVEPVELISYPEAKRIYKNNRYKKDFYVNAFIHFFVDDQLFDGPRNSIWTNYKKVNKLIKHFAGIITPDFSTYSDFPLPIKLFNFYRMRAYDHYMLLNNINVIHNVRWGTKETLEYCFDGIPKNNILAIGTVASNLRSKISKKIFEDGFYEMIKQLSPKIIIIYGSANYDCINHAQSLGIKIITFKSDTNKYYERRTDNE